MLAQLARRLPPWPYLALLAVLGIATALYLLVPGQRQGFSAGVALGALAVMSVVDALG